MNWHRQSVMALIFCHRLAESDVTVTPLVTCTDWLCWWHNHMAHLVSSSTTLDLYTDMVRNINLCQLLQSKWKISKRQSVLKRI